MNTDSTKPSIPPMSTEELNTFEKTQKQYAEHGMNLEEQLDAWAKRWAKKFEKLNLTYPSEGTVQEKWKALREASVEDRLDVLVSKTRNTVGRLQEPGWPSPKDLDPEKLAREMDEEEAKYPQLKPLIDQVRAAIPELRQARLDYAQWQLEKMASEIKDFIDRLRKPESRPPKKFLDPEKLEQEVSELEGRFPQLKPLIDKVRGIIGELREINLDFIACL